MDDSDKIGRLDAGQTQRGVGRLAGGQGSRSGLVVFFLLTYLVTWASWIAWAALGGGVSSGNPKLGLEMPIFYIGVFAPAFVAVGLTFRREGRAGVTALLSRLLEWNVAIRWYVFAVTYLVAIKLAAALVFRMATGVWPRFGGEPWYVMLIATVGSTLLFGQSGEEVGWRGYALPRLARRFGLGPASIVLGIIWATWHLPLFFIPGTGMTNQSFPLYLTGVTAFSVAIAWLYANTNGSLFLTMLMHAAINNTTDIVPAAEQNPTNPFALRASLIGWITVGLLWVVSGYLLLRLRLPRGSINSNRQSGVSDRIVKQFPAKF